LLRKQSDGLERLLQTIEVSEFDCMHLDPVAITWIAATARQYQSLSPQLADLSLLYLAKQRGVQHVFTLDRRDFSVYRNTNGKPFRLLPDNE
jgi:predicted nucleic acid-binding protein